MEQALDNEARLSWVDEELGQSEFPDTRLGDRFRTIVSRLSGNMGGTLPLACQDWAATKAAYRFLSNERISESAILSGHFKATQARFAATDGTALVLQPVHGADGEVGHFELGECQFLVAIVIDGRHAVPAAGHVLRESGGGGGGITAGFRPIFPVGDAASGVPGEAGVGLELKGEVRLGDLGHHQGSGGGKGGRSQRGGDLERAFRSAAVEKAGRGDRPANGHAPGSGSTHRFIELIHHLGGELESCAAPGWIWGEEVEMTTAVATGVPDTRRVILQVTGSTS